jgi:hypothetical protein
MIIFSEKHLGKGWHVPVRVAVSLLKWLSLTRLRVARTVKK